MAKSAIKAGATAAAAAPTPAASAAPVPVPSTAYTVSFGDAPPPAAAFGGGNRGAHNPIKTTMLAMPVPKDGKYAMFDVSVSAPDSITDPAEREKALSESLRKQVAKVSGVARRITKGDAAAKFTVRGIRGDGGTASVRVWRV